MPTKASRQAVASGFEWSQTSITLSDYQAGEADGTSVPAGSTPQELAYAEVSDDNGVDSQLASYDIVRLGLPLAATGDSAIGKLFADLEGATDGALLDDRTQLRWVARPRNGDQRRPLTDWFVLADVRQDDPRKRVPLPPVTNGAGEPVYIKEGRVLALEIRNPATSVTVSLDNSQARVPAAVGW